MEEEKNQDSELSLEEANFKVKFTRLTNYADYETSSCDVCCQKNDKYFPEGEEKGIQMMVCYGCGVKCHAYCYGIDTVTKEETIKGKADSAIVYFVCEKCRLEPKKPMSCVVCNQKKGALKKLDNSTHNEWVHVTCGLYNGGIIVATDYRQMKFSKANSSQTIEKDKKAKITCNFCKSDVGLRKCFSENCTQHAHVYCTLKYMQEKEGGEGEEQEWYVRLNYVQNAAFNVQSGCLMSTDTTFHHALRQSLNEISQIILGTPIFQKESSETIETNPQPSKQSQQKNARSSSRRNQNEERNLTSDQSAPAEEQSLGGGELQNQLQQQRIKYQSIVLNIGNKILKNLENADNQDKEFNKEKQLLGGEISLECPDHRRLDVYCVCQKAESSEDFVQCELCNDWYHYGCVNFSKKQADNSEKYRCPMCDEWYSHKKRRLLKEFGSGKTETCDILVGNVPKFNLMDFISVALFADTRIGILISNTKKQPAESAINDVISALSFIPLFSSKLQDLGLFKSRKYIQEGLNLFLTGIQEETDILKPVSAIQITQNPIAFTIIEENSNQNEQIKKQIDEISSVYSRCQAKEKGILTNLKKPVNWMARVHSQFFQKGLDKISPLILNDFTREDEETITCYAEYKYFEELLASSKNWNAKLFAVYEDILQRAIQKQASEEQSVPSNPKEKIEIDEEEFIVKKYDKWRERLSVKPTLSEIDLLIQEGRSLAVDCSQDIKKLEFEKDEVDIWCQVFEEFSRNSQNALAQLKARSIQDKDTKSEGDTMELEGKTENTSITESPELLISRNQQLTSKGDFEIQALKMMTKVLLQVPRMDQIIEMMQTYELNQLKWERITDFISSFPTLSNKSSFSLYKISSLELESLLHSSLSLPIKSLFLSQLYGLIEEHSRLKEKLNAVISAEFSETSYQQIHTDMQSSYFFFPTEEQTIEERLRSFKEISELFVDGQVLRKVAAEQISGWVTHAKSGKFPESIVASLEEKFQSVIEITEQILDISKNGIVEREQLALAKELEDKMRTIKTVDFKKEMEFVAKLEKSNAWFRNLHKFAFHLTPETALLPASQRVQHIDLELEDILDSKTIAECDEDIESRVSIIRTFFDSLGVELLQLVKEGLSIDQHADKRIRNRLTSLAQLCWTYDTESLLNKPMPMKIEQMISALSNAIFIKVDQENETFKRLNVIYQKALQERKEQEIIHQNKLLELEREQRLLKQMNSNQKKIIINPDSSDDEGFDEEDGSDSEEDGDDDDDNSDSYESDDGEDIKKKKEQIEIENSEDAYETSGDEQPEDNSGLNSEDSEKYNKLLKLGIKWNEIVEDYLSQIEKQNIGNSDNSMAVETSQKATTTLTFQQLKDSLQEGYGLIHDILLLKKSVGFLKKNMLRLETILGKVDQQLQRINEIRDADKVNDSILVENCIDVSDLLIEYKVSLESSPNIVISIKNLLKKPFNSLYKFKTAYNKLSETSYFSKSHESRLEKQKNESERKNQLKKIQKDQQQLQDSKKKTKFKNMNNKDDLIEIESSIAETGQNKQISDSQGVSLRQKSNRHRVKARDEDFVYGSDFVKQINKEEDKNEMKSIKVNQSSHKKKFEGTGVSNESAKHGLNEQFQKKQQQIMEESDIDEEDDDDSANLETIIKTDLVSDEDRKKSQELLKKNLNQNPIFSQVGQNPFKSIENQIFGEFHKNRKKYLVKIDEYIKMFVQLVALPLISKKILGKNFSTVTLDKLVNNQNLAFLEKTVRQQMNIQKQQQQQQQQQPSQNSAKTSQPNTTSNKTANNGSNSKPIQNKPVVQTAPSGNTSNAKTINNNTQQSSKESLLNSSKEPQPSKKFKSVDPLEKFLPPAPTSSEPTAASALSSLLFKSEKDTSSQSRQKDGRHSSKHDRHDRDDRHDRHSKYNRKERSRYSSSPSQNSRHKNKKDSYSTSNNNKKRHSSNQGNFSDESDSNDRQDTKQQQQQQQLNSSNKSSKLNPQDDSKRPQGFNPDAGKKSSNAQSNKYSQQYDSSQTPAKQIFVNKSDIEDIDQIQSTYISDSKVYQLDKTLQNSHKAEVQNNSPKNQEILFNPDADDDDADHDKEEQDIQAMNKKYFDQEDELSIGLSSITKVSKSQIIPISAGASSEKLKLASSVEHEPETIASPSSPVGISKLQYDKKAEQPTMEIEEADEPTPEGCVIRIAKCRIRTSKGASSLPAAMYTMDSAKDLKKFPLIDTSKAFEINSYTDFSQIKNYLDKQVNKSIIVLKGWFELQNPKSDSKRLLDAIRIQDSKDKVSGFKINGMTFNVFTERLIQKTDYKFTPKPCSSDLQALLPFIIYKKKTDPSPLSVGGPVNPFKFVKFVEDQRNITGSKNSKSSSMQEQQILSPITSEDEDKHERIDPNDLQKMDSLFQDKDSSNPKLGQAAAAAQSITNVDLKILQDIDLQSIQMSLLDIPTEADYPVIEAPTHSYSRQAAAAAPLRQYIPPQSYQNNMPQYSRMNQPMHNYQHLPPPPPRHHLQYPPLYPQSQPSYINNPNPAYVNQSSLTQPPLQAVFNPQEQEKQTNLNIPENSEKKDETAIDQTSMNIEEHIPEHLELDFKDIDFDFVQTLLQDDKAELSSEKPPSIPSNDQPIAQQQQPAQTFGRQSSLQDSVANAFYPPENAITTTEPNSTQNIQQLLLSQRSQSQETSQQPQQQPSGFSQNYSVKQQYPPYLPPNSAPPPPPHLNQLQQPQQWPSVPSANAPSQMYMGGIQGKGYGGYAGKINPNGSNHLIPGTQTGSSQGPSQQSQAPSYLGANGRGYPPNQNLGTGNPRGMMRFPPNASNYGNSMYNSGSPSNQQQSRNYIKYERGGSNQGKQLPQSQQYTQQQQTSQQLQPQQQQQQQQHQFKNHFGSRQQAHYQRNNQPYTAHNPVPFEAYDAPQQQQQSSVPDREAQKD